MDSRSPFLPTLHLILVLVVVLPIFADASSRLYIVYMGEKKHDDPSVVTASHHDALTSVFGSKDEAMKSIVYSYKHGFSGFAAMLTESQAEELAKLPGVVSVKPNTYHKAHTTRSWDFLGLNYYEQSNLLKKANYGEDVIVGGYGLHHEASKITAMALCPHDGRESARPVRSSTQRVARKIIGARWYSGDIPDELLKGEYKSPRDLSGHGTHAASTILGGQVYNVSHRQSGLAAGMARGGAPRARLAVYKACWGPKIDCGDASVLAAIDDAINDGVDVLSLSLGGYGEVPGTLHAVARGITVVFAGGNEGPVPQSVSNAVPWVITVAASTIDRSFPTVMSLGNKEKLVGQSLNYNATMNNSNFHMLVDGQRCDEDSLASVNITGKIVLCSAPLEAANSSPNSAFAATFVAVVKRRAKGLIYAQYSANVLDGFEDFCHLYLPASCVLVDYEIASRIASYAKSTRKSVVKISRVVSVVGNGVLAPRIAMFSSRGPSNEFPAILKPDISAPGVSILAAVGDSYKFMSGTSMACPHVSAVAALLKSVHPDWSPAMIKSAIHR
uniref:Inhibitor I9 domain-containing protein n=2 Tax=Oryza rufipogon TaxID=4529 RepID=A0A0E0NCT8_ORYRU